LRLFQLSAVLVSVSGAILAQTPVFTEYPVPAGSPNLDGPITAGPDGNLWFTAAGAIWKITLQGVITEYPLTRKSSRCGCGWCAADLHGVAKAF
jgi:streptogramin lyase